MRRFRLRRTWGLGLAFCCLFVIHSGAAASEEASAGDVQRLEERLEALADENREMRGTIERLEGEVRHARDEARAAGDIANSIAATPPVSAAPSDSTVFGQTNLRLLDISLNALIDAGFSSANDDELLFLQGGNHDPRQRGFSLPNLELSFSGAVDPWFTGEAHLIYFLDSEGESRFELEEAFIQTLQLPFGLERQGLQVELGHFFTEFGRLNPRHPHDWNWLDQPVIMSRLFGEDGMRGPGVRVGWLTPLPWYSELHLGAQTAKGETMVSFLANDEVFAERPIGGRPFGENRTGSPDDLVQLVRWVNGFDISETWSTQFGVSGLWGVNATGAEGRTLIYGADAVLKWRPLVTDGGWPFVVIEAEVLKRKYFADEFFGCVDEEAGCVPEFFPKDTLKDWGFYAQALWGFTRNWAAGIRYEHAAGDGPSLGVFADRNLDPFRADRHRISPLLVFHPSEFTRIRLQYNYDRADHLRGLDAHSVWAGFEVTLGKHGVHAY